MNAAVVLSGGTGDRFGFKIPKQYWEIEDKPVLVYTLERFERCFGIDSVIVVAAAEWKVDILSWKEEYQLTKLKALATAGVDRQHSILNGLLAAKVFSSGEYDKVIIQDAVRPLASEGLLDRILAGLAHAPCVMPVLPVTDTAYLSHDGENVDGLVQRSTLYLGQAPEGFRYTEYLKLYEETPSEELSSMTGSCQLPYSKGWQVKMIPGEQDNIKITYPSDLAECEMLMREKGELEELE